MNFTYAFLPWLAKMKALTIISCDMWYKLTLTLDIAGESSLITRNADNGTSTTHVLLLANISVIDISKLRIICGRSAGVIDRMYIDDFVIMNSAAE